MKPGHTKSSGAQADFGKARGVSPTSLPRRPRGRKASHSRPTGLDPRQGARGLAGSHAEPSDDCSVPEPPPLVVVSAATGGRIMVEAVARRRGSRPAAPPISLACHHLSACTAPRSGADHPRKAHVQASVGQTSRSHGDGAAVHYERHRPEQTTLYRLVQQHARCFFGNWVEAWPSIANFGG